MYGYIKQPDGVLKPILLEGIKNIVQSGNSVNIVYFQLGTSPLTILKVDQETYYNNGEVLVCDGTAVNGVFTLSGADYVNGDVKITFGAASAGQDLAKIVTDWINSVLSNKTGSNTSNTLNKFANQIEVGYTFSAEGTVSTALAYPLSNNEESCAQEPVVADSKLVTVFWDFAVDSVPPNHTLVYEVLFNEVDGTAALTPLNNGNYKLYNFIAAVQQPLDNSNLSPDCQYGNLYEDIIPANTEYVINTRAGGIQSLTVCDSSLQRVFSSDTTDPELTYTGWATQGSSGGPYDCPAQMPTTAVAQSVEYQMPQDNNGTYIFDCCNQSGLNNQQNIDSPPCPQTIAFAGDPEVAANQGKFVMNYGNNTINQFQTNVMNNYPFTHVLPGRNPQPAELGGSFPELAIAGLDLKGIKVPANIAGATYDDSLKGIKNNEEFWICSGIPTTLTQGHWLDSTGARTIFPTEGSAGSGIEQPMFFRNGIPGVTTMEQFEWTGEKLIYDWVKLVADGGDVNGINVRPMSLNIMDNNLYTVQKAVRPEYYDYFGYNPSNPAGQSNFLSINHNTHLWFRDTIKDKGFVGDWKIYNPSNTIFGGLPSGLTNNIQTDGPPFDQTTRPFPSQVALVPFLVPETFQPFLDAGFTHRAFGVNTQSQSGYFFLGGPPVSGVKKYEDRNLGVIVRQQRGTNTPSGFGINESGLPANVKNPGTTNKWFITTIVSDLSGTGANEMLNN